MTNLNDTVFKNMQEMEGREKLVLPPESYKEMEARIIEYKKGESMTSVFPVFKKYNNPAGVMLGGFLPVFFDLTIGPFSYSEVKKPTASLDLNVTFVRAVTVEDKEVHVTIFLIKKTKSFIILEGKAYTMQGELVGTASSRLIILDPNR